MLNLQNQGFIVFLPTYDRKRLKAGQAAIATEPLFPRYLLMQKT